MHNVRELLGQKVARTLLLHYLENDPPHLLIFHGPPGTGKTSAAEAFIRQRLCHAGTGCGTCPSCLQINRQHTSEGEQHPDYIRFPEIKIQMGDNEKPEPWTVRWLIRQRLIYAPIAGKSRYILFPDARLLLDQAETALLKTLEEPPPESFFIIITEDLSYLKETIQSRGVLIPFHYLGRSDLKTLTGQPDAELDILGGSLENSFWLATDFHPELKSKIGTALDHPLALLDLEKYLTDFKPEKIKEAEVSREELFDFALHEVLRLSQGHPQSPAIADHVFACKIDLRRNMAGLLPYLQSRFFYQMQRTLFSRRVDG